MTTDRLTTPDKRPEDIDAALRPKTLAEFVGQAAAKDSLSVFIESAKSRGEAMHHVLFLARPDCARPRWSKLSRAPLKSWAKARD